MKDYRYVIEELYKYRGRKSGLNWILYITSLISIAPDTNYIEKTVYESLIKLILFLFSNSKRIISHKEVRKYIENAIKIYDENNIGNLWNLFYIIDTFDMIDEYKDSELLENLKKIFI